MWSLVHLRLENNIMKLRNIVYKREKNTNTGYLFFLLFNFQRFFFFTQMNNRYAFDNNFDSIRLAITVTSICGICSQYTIYLHSKYAIISSIIFFKCLRALIFPLHIIQFHKSWFTIRLKTEMICFHSNEYDYFEKYVWMNGINLNGGIVFIVINRL